MKKLLLVTTIGSAVMGATASHAGLAFDFNGNQAQVDFNGGNVSLTGSNPAKELKVYDSSTHAFQAWGGLSGNWSIGTVQTVGTPQSPATSEEYAALTPNTLSITLKDIYGQTLMGTISGGTVDVKTFAGNTSSGTITGAVVNWGTYAHGGNYIQDLASLASTHSALTFSFQFSPTQVLTGLKSTGSSTSFTGSLTAVPEASTTVAGIGAVGVVLAGLGIRSGRGNVLRIGSASKS